MAKKELNGSDLAGFIKERQASQIRALDKPPKLAIFTTVNNPVTDTYIRLKQQYADDIGIIVDVHRVSMDSVFDAVVEANNDDSVDGIIIQLPIEDATKTDELLNSIAPHKDIDGLGKNTLYDPATPTAILWLLAGYNIDLTTKNILVVGMGRLVGAPLIRMLEASGINVKSADINTPNIKELCREAEVIISATGQPRLITADMVMEGAIIIDAGTATDGGEIVGDVDEAVRARDDVIITPKKGGVGPLTISALFENLLKASNI